MSQAVAVSADGDGGGMMEEPIQQGGIGEEGGAHGVGFVGSGDSGFPLLVASEDDLEEEGGVVLFKGKVTTMSGVESTQAYISAPSALHNIEVPAKKIVMATSIGCLTVTHLLNRKLETPCGHIQLIRHVNFAIFEAPLASFISIHAQVVALVAFNPFLTDQPGNCTDLFNASSLLPTFPRSSIGTLTCLRNRSLGAIVFMSCLLPVTTRAFRPIPELRKKVHFVYLQKI